MGVTVTRSHFRVEFLTLFLMDLFMSLYRVKYHVRLASVLKSFFQLIKTFNFARFRID